MTIVGLLVTLLVVCLLIWGTRALLAAFSIGDPIATVVQVVLVIVIVLYLISAFGYGGGGALKIT